MSAETELYTKLSGTSGITSLVSTRIYPDVLPEGCTYPAIVFARIRTEPVISLGGQSFGSDVELTLGAWGKTRTSSDAVAAAIASTLVGSAFVQLGREAAFDPETGLFASIISVLFFEV
jgi:hypothetical protein